MRHLVILGTVVLLACSPEADTENMKLVAGRQAVSEKLRDPGSAEFRGLRIGLLAGREVVCGEVNSKNGFGGMTGFQRFVSNGGAATVLEEQMDKGEFVKIWAASC